MFRRALSVWIERNSTKLSTLNTAFAVFTTRQITTMPISTGLPRQSFIFCLLLSRVITFRESFFFCICSSAAAPLRFGTRISFWSVLVLPVLGFVPAAGFTAEQKGFTK